ncbi:MAG: hypothetical protein KBT47_04250 [Armatimonadetes bacterium]|nr:hypothetical protein [Candidatus Hippobium faecium]
MSKKIKKTILVTKEELALKEETGYLPKKHKSKEKNFMPMDPEEYRKTADLRAKLNKNNPIGEKK